MTTKIYFEKIEALLEVMTKNVAIKVKQPERDVIVGEMTQLLKKTKELREQENDR